MCHYQALFVRGQVLLGGRVAREEKLFEEDQVLDKGELSVETRISYRADGIAELQHDSLLGLIHKEEDLAGQDARSDQDNNQPTNQAHRNSLLPIAE